jgi:hypothetical protein
MKRTTLAAAIATCTLALAAAVAVPATAAPADGSVIAEDTAPAPVVAPDATVVGVDANIVAGLSVSGHGGKLVTLTAKGEKSRTASSKASSPVVFKSLTPGKSYAVAIDGRRIGTAVPVSKPGAAYGLKVSTTGTPGEVKLTWSAQANRTAGKVTYQVAATPSSGLSVRSGALTPRTLSTETTTAVLSGLATDTLYMFTVTPANTAATGTASNASMTRTLGELSGTIATDPAPAPTPTPAPSTPTPSSSGGGGGASAPATRTIWVCPDGFTASGDACSDTKPYTYRTQTLTSAYTWHSETITTAYTYHTAAVGSHVVTHPPTHCDYLPNPNSPTGLDIYCYGGYDETVIDYGQVKDATPAGYTDNGTAWVKTVQVKDATPAGFTDNGTAWVKDVQVKDNAPAGYTDNGTAWVKTVSKVAQVVPA